MFSPRVRSDVVPLLASLPLSTRRIVHDTARALMSGFHTMRIPGRPPAFTAKASQPVTPAMTGATGCTLGIVGTTPSLPAS